MKNKSFSFIIWTLALIATGCNSYQKVLKSNDPQYKLKKAKEYYADGKHVSAAPLIEELISIYKGTNEAEELYWMFANSHYEQKNFLVSAFHFKAFNSTFPESRNAQEALFMHAKSYNRLSAKPSLEQTYTVKAIEAYQQFVNQYPNSSYLSESNISIDRMRRKLELKALNTAKLYYKTQRYRAAAVSYKQLVRDFPDIEESEEASFLELKSHYKFSEASAKSKKAERFEETIDIYETFAARYPNSAFLPEAQSILEEAKLNVPISTYEYGKSPLNRKKVETLEDAIRLAQKYKKLVQEDKNKQAITETGEKSYYELLKVQEEQARVAVESKKSVYLHSLVKNYYGFVDTYPQSKCLKDAENIFFAAEEKLKKLSNESN